MAEYTFSKIQRGSNLYILKDAGAARKTRYPSGNQTDETIKNFEERLSAGEKTDE